MSARAGQQQRIARTALVSAGIALGMAGLAYASVPLYRIFCQVTGFGGTTQVADAYALPSTEQVAALGGATVRVRFDGNVRGGLDWAFGPDGGPVEVRIGQQNMAFYKARNRAGAATTGTATFNVSPAAAGRYFNKIQCFCFNEQTLEPGQSADMPVIFFVDPAILDDPDARDIREITLSYSFFPVARPAAARGLTATGADAIRSRGRS
jgi:cytochrome c oxidase assembly protein subunit 11